LKRSIAALLIVSAAVALTPSCRKSGPRLYTIGVLQLFESSTLVEARRGFVRALEDAGLRDGINVRIDIRDGGGDPVKLQEHARDFVADRVDLIVPLSTQSLQAALIATSSIPIVFVSVANPYLTRAGVSSVDHLPNVTGVASTAPLREALALIKDALPQARRIGTLWTPSEINSGYYLDIVRTEAADFGFEIVTVPVAGPSDILLAAQILTNQKIDAVLPISDNTINAAFETVSQVANENRMPLFGGFLLAAKAGAAAAVGWDFFEMGRKAGRIALRIKAGERPAKIPFESMTEVRLILNLQAAGLQGLRFPDNLRRKADLILD
jgi:putative ABC transport system substrate-binding protein